MKMRDRKLRLTRDRTKFWTYIVLCLIIAAVCISIPTYMWKSLDSISRGFTSVRGGSMSPTINNNDILYVQPTKYERGEIVVAICPESDYVYASNLSLLKRIVGLPGETVKITKDGVFINNVLLEENYVSNSDYTFLESNKFNEIILSDDEYFLLGDNRLDSFDSRHVGAFHKNNFLYGLTLEQNDYTESIFIKMLIFSIIDIVVIIAFCFILFLLITKEPKEKRLIIKKH